MMTQQRNNFTWSVWVKAIHLCFTNYISETNSILIYVLLVIIYESVYASLHMFQICSINMALQFLISHNLTSKYFK